MNRKGLSNAESQRIAAARQQINCGMYGQAMIDAVRTLSKDLHGKGFLSKHDYEEAMKNLSAIGAALVRSKQHEQRMREEKMHLAQQGASGLSSAAETCAAILRSG